MPKYNADERTFEPIEVVINGKCYTVKHVSQNMFSKIQEIANGAQSRSEGEDSFDPIFEQLGVILDAAPEEFKDMDLRRAGGVLNFLMSSISSQIKGDAGNVSREG